MDFLTTSVMLNILVLIFVDTTAVSSRARTRLSRSRVRIIRKFSYNLYQLIRDLFFVLNLENCTGVHMYI
eukprot:SAG31_NODE_5149_length_2713_cov_6.205903_3_plen_70_part_00